jgi:hypothetical protein
MDVDCGTRDRHEPVRNGGTRGELGRVVSGNCESAGKRQSGAHGKATVTSGAC